MITPREILDPKLMILNRGLITCYKMQKCSVHDSALLLLREHTVETIQYVHTERYSYILSYVCTPRPNWPEKTNQVTKCVLSIFNLSARPAGTKVSSRRRMSIAHHLMENWWKWARLRNHWSMNASEPSTFNVSQNHERNISKKGRQ